MSIQHQSSASTGVELTLAEFASRRWPHALRLYRRARAAAGTIDALPTCIKLANEKRTETEADQLLKSWDDRRRRQILGLREMDPLRQSHDLALRANAIERVRTDIDGKIRARYRAMAEKIGKFFAVQLAEECRKGATVRTRHPDNRTLETLTRSDILDGVLDVGDNVLFSKGQRWVSVSVSLPTDAPVSEVPPNEPASSEPSATDGQKREWMRQYRRSLKNAGKKHGREIILSAAMDHFNVLYKDVRSIWDAPESNTESP